MKGRRMNKLKMKGRAAAAFAMALLMTWFMVLSCLASSDAEPADGAEKPVNDAYSITVNAPDGDDYAELEKADIALDFYKIAAAEKTADGFYVFSDWDEPFLAQQKMWEDILDKLEEGKSPDAEQISSVTQALAGVVLGGDTAKKYDTGETPVIFGQSVSVEPGFYMIVPHGNGLAKAQYVIAEDTVYTTIAKGSTKTFHFTPILVSVPVRGTSENAGSVTIPSGTAGIDAPQGVDNTLSEGDFANDVSVTAKVGIEGEGIPLTIVKILPVYEASEPAAFIFEVTATFNGNTVYNDVAQVTVSKPYPESAPKQITLKDRDGKNIELPAGCTVTVLEKYAGTSYTPDEPEVTIESLSAEENSVTFINRYAPNRKSGGSVENRVYLAGDGADPSGFEWKIEQAAQAAE